MHALSANTQRIDQTTATQAKTQASAPSSSKQKPFKKLSSKSKSEENTGDNKNGKNGRKNKISKIKTLNNQTPKTSSHNNSHKIEEHLQEQFDELTESFTAKFRSMQKEMGNLCDIVKSVQENSSNLCASCASCSHTKPEEKQHHSKPRATPSFKSVSADEKYFIQENVTKDANNHALYELTIGVPGYETDDITVKLHDIKQKDKSGKTLEICAQKKTLQELPDKKDTNIKVSQQFMSRSIINGKKRELVYKDGVLTIKLDLPNDISGDYYTMSLENDKLIISLPKNSTNQETTVLEFKKPGKK